MTITFYDPYDRALGRLSRKEKQAYHLQKLREAVEYAYHRSPFYRRLWESVGVKPESIKSLEDFSAKIPMVTKQDFLEDQKRAEPYGERLAVPVEDICQVHLTSGTTGIGQETYALAREDMESQARGWVIHLNMMGLKPGDVSFLTWPVGTMAAAFNVMEASRYLGLNTFIVGIYDTETRIRMMRRFPPKHMVATATYLVRLSIVCQEMGLTPRQAFPQLKGITIGGEGYPLEWAKSMSEVWGCPIHEMYGATQTHTLLASTCPPGIIRDDGRERGSLHFMEHLAYVEVVDPETGAPVEYDQEGELVVTPLFRRGTPVIRFRTKDRVTRYEAGSCACGCGYDFIQAGTVGRIDDMIKIKAANVWPQTVDDVLFSFPEVEEYNGIVGIDEKGREEARILLEFRRELIDAEKKQNLIKQAAEKIRQKTQVSMVVEEVPYGSLERALFKSRRWQDRRKEGLKVIKFTEKIK